MAVTFTFAVEGTPVPQGSMSVFNGRIVHQKSKQLMAWRNAIHIACRDVMLPLDGPVKVEVDFMLAQPKSTKRTTPYVKPDVDKLARAALDGLTGAAFHDDCQVIELRVRKEYGMPGAFFTVWGAEE